MWDNFFLKVVVGPCLREDDTKVQINQKKADLIFATLVIAVAAVFAFFSAYNIIFAGGPWYLLGPSLLELLHQSVRALLLRLRKQSSESLLTVSMFLTEMDAFFGFVVALPIAVHLLFPLWITSLLVSFVSYPMKSACRVFHIVVALICTTLLLANSVFEFLPVPNEAYSMPKGVVFLATLVGTIAAAILFVVSATQVRKVQEAEDVANISTQMAQEVAQAMVKYDLDSARSVCEKYQTLGASLDLSAQLERIIANLQVYRPFLPDALLAKTESPAGEQQQQDDQGAATQVIFVCNVEDEPSSPGPSLHLTDQCKERFGTVMLVTFYGVEFDIHALAAAVPIIQEETSRNGGVVDVMSPTRVYVTFNVHFSTVMHEEKSYHCVEKIASRFVSDIGSEFLFTLSLSSGIIEVRNCGTQDKKWRAIFGVPVHQVDFLAEYQRQMMLPVAVCKPTAAAIRAPLIPVDVLQPSFMSAVPVYEPADLSLDVDAVKRAFSRMRAGKYQGAIEEMQGLDRRRHKQIGRLWTICEEMLKKLSSPLEENGREYRRRYAGWVVEGLQGAVALERDVQFASSLTHFLSSVGEVPTAPMASPTTSSVVQRISSLQRKEVAPPENSLIPMYLPPVENEETFSESLTSLFPQVLVDEHRNKWRVAEKPKGRGAFSSVHMAVGEYGKPVVVKVFDCEQNHIDSNSLAKEVETLSQATHENIVGYISYNVTSRYFFIIMEYVSGGSMHDLLLWMKTLPEGAVRNYIRDALYGLQYLHDRGIAHCDIKPQNLLLSSDGRCKLADFGSALNLHQGFDSSTSTSLPSGAMRGTARYMAPEACRGQVDLAGDIWSLAMTTLVMLTGKPPFEERPMSDARFVQFLGKNHDVTPLIPKNIITSDFGKMLAQCLNRDSTKRPTATQLLQFPVFL